MPRRKATNTLAHLSTGERAQVLSELLKRHADLRGEANAIAENLIDDVSVEAVADEVADLVTNIGLEEIGSRAGKHSLAYVEPSQAAWDLLEDSIEDIRADMKRRFEAGMKPAAEKVCHGIVLGLHRAEGKEKENDGALGWAPDFPAEAAAWSLLLLLELYPQRQRRAAGNRILQAIEEHADDWVEMLDRVVDEAASASRRGRS